MPTGLTFGYEAFAKCIQPFIPFDKSPTIAVGVSGGSDSMALILLANHWAKTLGGNAIALTVDHGLRPESYQEAENVRKWLNYRGVEHHTLTWEGEKPRSNIQEEARKKRYELLVDWCKSNNINYLLTAHHLDDQAETVALHIARGSGVDGLSGIAPLSHRSGVHIIRPLLGVSKYQLQAFLEEQNQAWIEDPSNQSPHFARSALRSTLNTYADAALITKRLADTAQHMARVRNYLETQTDHAVQNSVTLHPEGYVTLSRSDFLSLHEEIALRLLTRVLCTISGHTEKTRFRHLETLYHSMKQGKTATLHGCKIALNKQGSSFLIYREYAAIPAKTPLSLKPILWDNRFLIAPKNTIQVIKCKEMNIVPLGSFSWPMLYSHYPELKKSPIPKPALKTFPLLINIENSITIPHFIPINGKDPYWDIVFKPLKPLTEPYFYYSSD